MSRMKEYLMDLNEKAAAGRLPTEMADAMADLAYYADEVNTAIDAVNRAVYYDGDPFEHLTSSLVEKLKGMHERTRELLFNLGELDEEEL